MHKKYLPIIKTRNPKSLQNCLEDFKKSWEEFDKLYEISKNWELIIGKELFKECKPLKIDKKILTIVVNHPQWRQALIYNKHRLKERIKDMGIDLCEIRIIQDYELKTENIKTSNAKIAWANHPSRIHQNNMSICKVCNSPTPEGELKRWGRCSFCWRKKNK